VRFKRPIYRYLFFAAWIVVLSGIISLVIAANGKTSSRKCKGIEVAINGDGDQIFIEKSDILRTIERTAKGSVVKKSFSNIKLGDLEKSLEKNAWIRDAELYFDTKDYLHVSIWERQPIARVFTTAGTSFYIDSAGYQLPLLETYSVKLPVVTGFTSAKRLNADDSLTLKGLKQVVNFISQDPFWNVQVGQIDITPDRKLELVPMIGSHIIKLGFADNVQAKLENLMVFYKNVLPKAGLTKYSVLDVQFEGQVVAVRKGATSVVDSLQLHKNIEELMRKKAAEQEPDDAMEAVSVKNVETILKNKDSIKLELPVKETTVAVKTSVNPNPDLKKTSIHKSNPVKPTNKQKSTAKTPKAVMPRKVQHT
jgi:cell division protein FtsQ